MSAAFRFEHVTKKFRKQVALDNLSLECPKGVVFALLGENGAGKTTAIRILLGLERPGSGTSEVLGIDSRSNGQEIRRRTGHVSESPTLYDWMTVAEIGWFASGFYPQKYLDNYKAMTERFGLPGKKKIKTLSKGMRAKVALSLAMAHEPELLLLDEPTSGLDSIVRREFLENMVDVAASGRTVFLSSHQIAEVERVADYVALLREGKLIFVEKLSVLKKEVCEVTLTTQNGKVAFPELPGKIIYEQFHQRQQRLWLKGSAEENIQFLRSQKEVSNAEVRMPSLEEIFVSVMKSQEDLSSFRTTIEPEDLETENTEMTEDEA